MNVTERNKLEGFSNTLKVFEEYGIYPTNTIINELRELYIAIGHQPTGTCGGCTERIMFTLIDHCKEEGIQL